MKKMKPLSSEEIRNRIISNAGREGKFAFQPTAMAVAMVKAAVA